MHMTHGRATRLQVDEYLDDVPAHVRTGAAKIEPTWVALDQKDHVALIQLLDRAERAGEARGLTAFIRTLLREGDAPAPLQRGGQGGGGKHITGQRCKRGHVSERYVIGGACVECARYLQRRRQRKTSQRR